jgi:hypothetical protein
MPQLKKVVLAVGNRLIYADTYDAALAQLAGSNPLPVSSGNEAAQSQAPVSTSPIGADARLRSIATHLQKYQELTAQGRLAEAGKELEAIKAELKQ